MTKRLTVCAMWVFALGTAAAIAGGQSAQSVPTTERQKNAPGATREQFERWMKELNNWGRWGKDDQLGTANLYTPEKRKQALALAKTGTTVSLGHDVADEKGSDANNPFAIRMIISSDPPLVTVVHKFAVVARGMNLLDNLDLEAAAETAVRLKRWEFMVTVNPLRIPKGTGSPINPIAFF